MKTTLTIFIVFMSLMFLIGHEVRQTINHADVQKEVHAAIVAQLQETVNRRETALAHFLGAEQFQRYSSAVNILVPVSYIREGYATKDLLDFKFMQIGDWVSIDSLGLIRIVGIKERGENTITIAGTQRGMEKASYLRRVDWMR